MTTILSWGTFSFDDSEVTKISHQREFNYVQIEKITGYPDVQQVGDRLDSIKLSCKFTGTTARTRLNDLRSFAIGTSALMQQGSTVLGTYVCTSQSFEYEAIATSGTTVISVEMDFLQDS